LRNELRSVHSKYQYPADGENTEGNIRRQQGCVEPDDDWNEGNRRYENIMTGNI